MVGIYALYWWDKDLIYIGKSDNISRRFNEHKLCMIKGTHTNYKVQRAYNKYGFPDFITIQECSLIDINKLEVLWQEEFNSLKSLDLIKAGIGGSGVDASRSKYSKLQILQLFRLLRNPNLSYKSISDKTGVSYGNISNIVHSRCHVWLREKYPKLFAKIQLVNRIADNTTKLKKYKDIILYNKDIEVKISSISNFCREYNQHISSISRVINGERNSSGGWKLKR